MGRLRQLRSSIILASRFSRGVLQLNASAGPCCPPARFVLQTPSSAVDTRAQHKRTFAGGEDDGGTAYASESSNSRSGMLRLSRASNDCVLRPVVCIKPPLNIAFPSAVTTPRSTGSPEQTRMA